MLGKLAAASDSCLALLQRNLPFFKSFQAHRTVTESIPQCLSIGRLFRRYLISTLSKEELYLRSRCTGCSVE